MRPVVLGRKNWIHIGSPEAGLKIAAILSVVESCRRIKLSVRDYPAPILPGLADIPIQRVEALTSFCMAPDPNVIGRLARAGQPKPITAPCGRGVRDHAREFLSPEFPVVNDPKQN